MILLMNNKALTRWKDWLLQAENDLKWAKLSLDNNFFAQCCFVSQQVAEKSLKAYAFFQGHDAIRGHSVMHLALSLNINGEILKAAKQLDLFYIGSRFPDGVPMGPPFEYYIQEQAQKAYEDAQMIYRKVYALTLDEDFPSQE